MNLSKNLLIIGTKHNIPKKTVGHATISLSIHKSKNIPSFTLKKIITAETVVLVQNDMITAKIRNLYFSIYILSVKNLNLVNYSVDYV